MTKQYTSDLTSEEALCATLNELIDDITDTDLLSNHIVNSFLDRIQRGHSPPLNKREKL